MASTIQRSYRNDAVAGTKILVVAGSVALVGWNLMNFITTDAYLKLYNAAATTDVTVGTTTPVTTLMIPNKGLFWQSNEDKYQKAFPLGVVIVCTTEMVDSGTTAPGTGCYVELFYNPDPNV